MTDPTTMKKAATKREAGEDFPAAAFAYTPDTEKPSTWKLRLWDSLSEKETPRQVGMAIAALGAGFRGNKVEIPQADMGAVKERVAAAWKKTHPDSDPADMPSTLKKNVAKYQHPAFAKALPFMVGTPSPEEEASAEDAAEAGESLASCLNTLLGDAFTMYVQAHGAHWNTKGQLFSQYHEFFGSIADDIHESLDEIAENILKLGFDAPSTVSALVAARELQDPNMTADTPAAMTASLLSSNVVVLDSLQDCFEAATRENQQGIANFIAERIDMHQKWAWQMRSSIDAQPKREVM